MKEEHPSDKEDGQTPVHSEERMPSSWQRRAARKARPSYLPAERRARAWQAWAMIKTPWLAPSVIPRVILTQSLSLYQLVVYFSFTLAPARLCRWQMGSKSSLVALHAKCHRAFLQTMLRAGQIDQALFCDPVLIPRQTPPANDAPPSISATCNCLFWEMIPVAINYDRQLKVFLRQCFLHRVLFSLHLSKG